MADEIEGNEAVRLRQPDDHAVSIKILRLETGPLGHLVVFPFVIAVVTRGSNSVRTVYSSHFLLVLKQKTGVKS